MSIVKFCKICKDNTTHFGFECLECKSKNKRDEKEESLIGRSKLSIEERISLIESNIFDINNKPQTIVNNQIFGSFKDIEKMRDYTEIVLADSIRSGKINFNNWYKTK